MSDLHLSGWLRTDYNGIICLSPSNPNESFSSRIYDRNLIEEIEDYANEYGMVGKHNQGLGGTRSIIDNCNLRIYFTDVECDLEEAMMSLDNLMYGGDLETKVTRVGYSEYTITGLDLNDFKIGGHDLHTELLDHYGEYCHFIIE